MGWTQQICMLVEDLGFREWLDFYIAFYGASENLSAPMLTRTLSRPLQHSEVGEGLWDFVPQAGGQGHWVGPEVQGECGLWINLLAICSSSPSKGDLWCSFPSGTLPLTSSHTYSSGRSSVAMLKKTNGGRELFPEFQV